MPNKNSTNTNAETKEMKKNIHITAEPIVFLFFIVNF